MERPKFKWCRETIAQIRFKLDRDKIRNELMAHIEDRCEALKERGIAEEEAEAKAVASMGDPVEVGKQLDAVHKPLLGWIWRISRWLAIIAVLVVLWCLLLSGMFSDWNSERLGWQEYLNPEADVVQHSILGEQRRNYYWEEDGKEVSWDRYTFRIRKAAVWENTMYDLYGCMTVSGFLPWEDYLYLNEAYAVDDLGNRYQNFQSIYFDRELYEESGWKMLNLSWGAYRTLTTWWYDFTISGLDPEAQWVELRYERAGRNLALRIDLTGGEGA